MIHLPACTTLAKALHDGATAIRVPVVPQPYLHPSLEDIWMVDLADIHGAFHEKYLASVIQDHSPLGKPGDVIGIQEAWECWLAGDAPVIEYEADPTDADPLTGRKWHAPKDNEAAYDWACENEWGPQPAHTMPDWAVRLRYRVKAVRVERLWYAWTQHLRAERGGLDSKDYAFWWDSRLTPDEYDEDGSFVRKGDRYGDVYPFDENPWTVAAEVVREEEK